MAWREVKYRDGTLVGRKGISDEPLFSTNRTGNLSHNMIRHPPHFSRTLTFKEIVGSGTTLHRESDCVAGIGPVKCWTTMLQ